MVDLSDFYPSPSELMSSERDVLAFLRTHPYIKEVHPQVSRDAQEFFNKNRAATSGFEFFTHFDVHHGAVRRSGRARHIPPVANLRLVVAARLSSRKRQFEEITYCLAVCRLRGNRVSVLRKFHFDVAVDSIGRGQEHPRSHLQYCGKMVPYMATIGCREEQLEQMHPWLSEPRIFHAPMSLALLIDLALHEFPDVRSAKFRADNYWRKLVRDQEGLVLKPFYEKCVEVITDNAGENQSLSDAFYVR